MHHNLDVEKITKVFSIYDFATYESDLLTTLKSNVHKTC